MKDAKLIVAVVLLIAGVSMAGIVDGPDATRVFTCNASEHRTIVDDVNPSGLLIGLQCNGEPTYFNPLTRELINRDLTRRSRAGRMTSSLIVERPALPACAGELGCVAAALDYCAQHRTEMRSAMFKYTEDGSESCNISCANPSVRAIENTCKEVDNTGGELGDATCPALCNPACGPMDCSCDDSCDETDPDRVAR